MSLDGTPPTPLAAAARPPATPRLPCRTDPDLWFSERTEEIEAAKRLCQPCPVRARCLAIALDNSEPWGVWGGEWLEHGRVVPRKRGRGRPRKDEAA